MGDLSKAGICFLVAVNDDEVAGIEMAGFRRLPRIHGSLANKSKDDMSDNLYASGVIR